ncbi:MAG: polysaccharide pyruvyl transferase family protein [Alphaproteobacteria bacterium]
MARILVMIPAGELYNHDCVRWYSPPDGADAHYWINSYHNIGDAFVYDSALKLIDFKDHEVFVINAFDPKRIDRYNAEFDFVLLRGSNYIHGAMDWLETPECLAHLKIPVLAFGIGAQAPSRGPLVLSDATIKVMRAIADRCESMGVRGSYTAQVLWDIGIKNTRIIGCPTVFRHRNPDLRIDLPPIESVRNVGYTLRREVSPAYALDTERYLAFQRKTILAAAKRFTITVMAQGEVEEKKLALGGPSHQAEAWAALQQQSWISGAADPMAAIYRGHLFYSDRVAAYDEIVRQQDLVLGYRLHGNLIALANQTPSIYFTYDSRTAEFVETFAIPAHDVYAGKDFVLEEYWQQSLFERFNRSYHHRWRDMKQFLEENNIPHRMGPSVTDKRVAEAKIRHVA